ncbi:hypothetical protein M2S06_07640, partial [Apilactobacillus sp. TMW 2.2457]|nr:hypothetical protein [Apilactobacillus xinyiensis]
MQFNKKEFNKINEKKKLKKVKKQWVVVSLSTFTMLAGAYVSNSNTTKVNADNVIDEAKVSSAPVSGSDKVDETKVSSAPVSGSDKVDETKVSSAPVSGSDKVDEAKVSSAPVSDGDKVDEAKVSSAPVSDGDKVDEAKVSSAPVSDGNKVDEANVSSEKVSDGNKVDEKKQINTKEHQIKNLMMVQEQKVSEKSYDVRQAFVDGFNGNNSADNDTPEYSNGSKAWDAFNKAYNDAANGILPTSDNNKWSQKGYQAYQTALQAVNDVYNNQKTDVNRNLQSYYDLAYQGALSAKNKYNSQTNGFGTNDKYSQFDDSNTNDPDSAKKSVNDYNKNLSKMNSADNYSVDNYGQLSIPNINDCIINSADSPKNREQNLVYLDGIKQFLAKQGYNDAESGKWNGITKNSNRTPISIYTPDDNSDNPYDQAYLGAQSAMKQQWQNADGTNDTYVVGNDYSYQSSGNTNQYFVTGVNDVSNQIKSGTIFVSNGIQVIRATSGNTYSQGSKQIPTFYGSYMPDKFNSNVKNIKFTTDINLDGASYTEVYLTNPGFGDQTLTIDAQNHLYDSRGQLIQYNGNKNSNLNLQNFKGMYGWNFYGDFKINAGSGSTTFNNVNYIGPQMISATASSVYIEGTINAYLTSKYYSPFTPDGKNVEGNGNQEVIECINMTLQPNAHFYGSTAEDGPGGTGVDLSGNLSLSSNSKMTIVPRSGGGATSLYGANIGVYFASSGSTLNVSKNARLNIIPSNTTKANRTDNAVAIYSNVANTSINVDGGIINIESDGPTLGSGSSNNFSTIFLNGSNSSVMVTNQGAFVAHQSNLGQSNFKTAEWINTNNALFNNNNGKLTIVNRGKFELSADGDNAITLYSGKNTQIINGKLILDLSKNTNNKSKLTDAKLDAYSVVYRDSPNIDYTKTLYNLSLNPSSKSLLYRDIEGEKVGDKKYDNYPYLETDFTPSISFSGPIDVDYTNGTITGYVKVYNHDINNKVYMQYGYYKNSTSVLPIGNPQVINDENVFDNNKYNSNFNGKYDDSIALPDDYVDGQSIKFVYKFDGSKIPNLNNSKINVDARYVTSIVSSNIDKKGNFNSNAHGYTVDDNKNVKNALDVPSDYGNVQTYNDGTQSGILDSRNLNNYSKDKTRYGSDFQYTNGYDSAQHGYDYFNNKNLNNDPNDNHSIIPSDDIPSSFIKGFNSAKQDYLGYEDGANDYLNHHNNDSSKGSNAPININSAYNRNYDKGYSLAQSGFNSYDENSYSNFGNEQYNNGYLAASNAYKGYLAYKNNPNDIANHTDTNSDYDLGYMAAYNAMIDSNDSESSLKLNSDYRVSYDWIYKKSFRNPADKANDSNENAQSAAQSVNQSSTEASSDAIRASKAASNAQVSTETANSAKGQVDEIAKSYAGNSAVSTAASKASQAMSDAQKANSDAQSQKDKAASASSNASLASIDANRAASEAASASQLANEALSNANTAAEFGDSASALSYNAKAQSQATIANDAASQAVSKQSVASQAAVDAKSAADQAEQASNAASAAADKAKQALSDAQKAANIADTSGQGNS